MDEFNKKVGLRLKEARTAKGLSRKKLGDILDIHETTIKKYEDGKIIDLSINQLIRFAEALNVEAKWLIGWEEKPQKSNIVCFEVEENTLTNGDIKDVQSYIDFVQSKKNK